MNKKLLDNFIANPGLAITDANVSELEALVLYCKDTYYNSSASIVDDNVYDQLEDELRKRHPKSAALEVTSVAIRGQACHLPIKMPSLDKASDMDTNLDRYVRRAKSTTLVVTDKLDGVSLLLFVRDGEISLYTRGDGKSGQCVTDLADYLAIPKIDKQLFIARGELVVNRDLFESRYADKYKNARNFVSGVVNSDNKYIAADLDFVVFDLVYPRAKYTEGLRIARENELNVVQHVEVDNINDFAAAEYLSSRRLESSYAIDGLVIRQNIKGELPTIENPKHSIAFKTTTDDAVKTTTVRRVEWRIASTGRLIPRIHTDPVELSGAIVRRFTGNNYRFIQEAGIGEGAIIKVRRAGEVIPQILGIIQRVTPSKPPMAYKVDNDVHAIAVDAEDGDNVELTAIRIYKLFKALNVPYFTKKSVFKLVEAGFVTVTEILNATEQDLYDIEGINALRLSLTIDNVLKHPVSLSDLMYGSWHFGSGLGRKTAELICDVWPSVLKDAPVIDKEAMQKQLLRLPRVSYDLAEKFVNNIEEFANWVDDLPIKLHEEESIN